MTTLALPRVPVRSLWSGLAVPAMLALYTPLIPSVAQEWLEFPNGFTSHLSIATRPRSMAGPLRRGACVYFGASPPTPDAERRGCFRAGR